MSRNEEQVLERRLFTIQVMSGLLFSVFMLLHLFNQMLASLGPEIYNDIQRVLRAGYQFPVIEIALVLAPLLVHVVAAVWRVLRRRKRGQATPSSWTTRLHRISGIVLLIFFAGHILATRGASFLYGVFPEFEGIAYTFRWVPLYFWPYYTAFALAGLYHTFYGLSVALPIVGVRWAGVIRKPAVIRVILIVGGFLLLLGLFGLGGVLFDVGCPEEAPYPQLLKELGFANPDPSICKK